MTFKESSSGLGRTIRRDRFKSSRGSNNNRPDQHSQIVEDGPSWAQVRSITEQSDLDELMQLAQLSRKEFASERSSAMILNNPTKLSGASTAPNRSPDDGKLDWIRLPRRPKWRSGFTGEELHKLEEEAFLDWRRGLAQLEEAEHFILTPFERNLDIWRQLWRVVDACNTVVQVLDARNPLLFYCEDLKTYLNELDPSKRMLLLINKADFLSAEQRKMWASYFVERDLEFIFYSAKQATEALNKNDDNSHCPPFKASFDPWDIIDRDFLLDIFKKHCNDSSRKIGMVGYPNVGKSSTINSIVGNKKVAVAATPGKTKHFQTIILENGVTLYDCPGLVFPNFAFSKADLVLNGVLPIDQLRDWVSPTSLLIDRIPRDILERIYGLQFPKPGIEEDPNRKLTTSELLSSLAAARGFRTSFHGNPDESRSARVLLKDYVNGKILFNNPPPSIDFVVFNQCTWDSLRDELPNKLSKVPGVSYSTEFDSNLMSDLSYGVYMKGGAGSHSLKPQLPSSKKHYKMNKKK